jgi:hypothetical protein
MAIKTRGVMTCDRCGEVATNETNERPQSHGFVVLMVTGADGMQFTDCDGHLCRTCRLALHKWIAEKSKLIQ